MSYARMAGMRATLGDVSGLIGALDDGEWARAIDNMYVRSYKRLALSRLLAWQTTQDAPIRIENTCTHLG